jgi:NAD(P)H-hydrate epimerase
MKYILTPDEARLADSLAINNYNIPAIVLMENAAHTSAQIIEEVLAESNIEDPQIIILCGSGNNGGDGFAIARHLQNDYSLIVYWIGDQQKMSNETRTNFDSIKKIGVKVIQLETEAELETIDFDCDCLIDSLIGVGGSENIKGLALQILKRIKSVDAIKIAIDVPTGLNAETGIANNDCFVADYTITMFAIKTGMLINDGIDVCGDIHIANLGAPISIIHKLANVSSLDEYDVASLLSIRNKKSSKYNFGRVLVIAGSRKYSGAGALCANAAIKSGAGVVVLCSTIIHPAILPEVITQILDENPDGTISSNNINLLLDEANKSDSIVIGPGIGDNDDTIKLVYELIQKIDSDKPLLIDADGLRVIRGEIKLRENIVLTPHCGEFSALSGISRNEIEKNSNKFAKEWAEKLGCIILLKNVPSVITNGKESYWNIYGNPGMSTAGSGDVLSGIIGKMLAQKNDPLIATAVGAYIHSKAGDIYENKYNQESLTATSLIDCLKKAFIF